MRGLILAGAWLLVAPGIALAEATPDGAREIVGTFHKYFGEPSASRDEYVTVVPQGDAYRVTLDLDAMAEPLEAFGFDLDPAEHSFTAQPLPDGTWRVGDEWMSSPMTFRAVDTTSTFRFGRMTSRGIYDPALPGYASYDMTMEDVETRSTSPEGDEESRYEAQTMQMAAADDGSGGVDLGATVSQRKIAGSSEFSLPDPDTGTESAPAPDRGAASGERMSVSYSLESIEQTVRIKSLDASTLAEIWREAIARAQDTTFELDNVEAREWLTKLLPIYESADQEITGRGLHVTTPVGEFAVDKMGMTMSASGIVPDGSMAIALTLDGPSFPEELVPLWARDLVAKSFTFDVGISGFDLEAFARRLIDDLDIERTPVLEDYQLADAAVSALADEGLTVSLRPSAITGPILGLEIDGEMTAHLQEVSGSFNLTVTGLQEAMAAAQAGGADPTAQQMLGALAIGQMLAKPTVDGASFFHIEMMPDGSVSVNGQVVKPAASPTEKEL